MLAFGASIAAPFAGIDDAAAQQSRQAPAAAPRLETLRERTNSGMIGLVSGGVEGTYVRIAADLAAVLDAADLRVLPILGKGSVQNTLDIMFLRGVDIGIVQSDVLAYLKRERTIPGVERSIHYIAKLYNEELHLLGGRDVAGIAALAGKKVNVDSRGSGTFITATLLFEKLGIAVEMTHFDQALALEKLRAGEIAALAYVAGRPTRLFRDVKAEEGLRFLPVTPTDALLETYLPAALSATDYPNLIAGGESVETIAVGAVMAVYGWPRNSERYQRVAHFVDAFFARFPQLLQAPRHAKWKEVNLAAQLPGWTRFGAAESALAAYNEREGKQRQLFSQFLDQVAPGVVKLTPEQRDALFTQFVEWQRTGATRPAAAAAR
ncbi:MAG: TRAP transporter substrate-binding protein [Alphaproteobacteria bacterium]|nr:TRAP transporter substrate-binding protein [Alphaproteobacteria bacterium]